MSILKLTPDNFEQFSLQTNPSKTFSSSSMGITGSIKLFARRSTIEKETQEPKTFNSGAFTEYSITEHLENTKKTSSTVTNINSAMTTYMNMVNVQNMSSLKNTSLQINRFVPDFKFNETTLKKSTFKDILIPHYRRNNPNITYGYTNYNTLNFFTASSVPSDSALLYPSSASSADPTYASGSYSLPGPFTFEFYLNPRYTTSEPGQPFQAGTILHLSSTYAVSLITGSLKDMNGYPNSFRLMLQLSHSADVAPSKVNLTNRNFPHDMVYISDDNILKKNHWHHCAIRWGTNNIDHGSGSFIVDLKDAGSFVVTSSTINPVAYKAPQGNPSVLVVGNYYEGTNSGNNAQILFFGERPANRDGLRNMVVSTKETPDSFRFDHPLNAEIHEVKIYKKWRTEDQLYSSSMAGPSDVLKELAFYLPPFFIKQSPFRTSNNGTGGILETPFQASNGSTSTPINVPLAFRIGVRDISLENFTRDFKTGNHPRLFHLTSSNITKSSDTALSSSNFMYATGSFRKRNLTILPCDNGKFIPNFDLLKSGTVSNLPKPGNQTDRFVNSLNNLDLSLISLDKLIETGSLPVNSSMRLMLANNYTQGFHVGTTSMYDSLVGVDDKKYGGQIGQFLAIYYKTKDNSSNEISLYDISNLYYGYRISPGSFKIKDTNITGSDGKVQITLKDNGFGSLYRADALTSHPTWATVGSIFYNEGIVGVLSPHILYHGKNGYEINFKGENTLHIQKIHLLAQAGQINSSSNPTYDPLISASLNANNSSEQFVYISGINLMDENLNTVMKANLSQPIIKKVTDRLAFNLKIDF